MKILSLCLASILFKASSAQMNFSDFQTKGMDSLFEIANFTNHIPTSYQVFPGMSDDIIAQMEVFKQITPYIAAGGYAAVFPDQIDSKSQFYSMNNIDKMYYMLSNYTTNFMNLLAYSDKSNCSQIFYESANLIVSQFHDLYLYMRVKKGYDKGDIAAQEKVFTDAYENNNHSDAFHLVINGMLGQKTNEFECDLMFIQYQGSYNQYVQRGYRDMVTANNAYLLSLIASGIVIESAYRTMKSSKENIWIPTQQEYTLKLKQIISRIAEIDHMMAKNYLEDVRSAIVQQIYYLDPTIDMKTLGDSLLSMAEKQYDGYYWVIKVFNATDTKTLLGSYFNCKECFTLLDSIHNYFIFVAAIPKNSTGDPEYLKSKDWQNLTFNDQPKTIATFLYNNKQNCLQGVQAQKFANNDYYVALSDWDGFYQYQTNSTDTSVLIWSIQGSPCFNDSDQSLVDPDTEDPDTDFFIKQSKVVLDTMANIASKINITNYEIDKSDDLLEALKDYMPLNEYIALQGFAYIYQSEKSGLQFVPDQFQTIYYSLKNLYVFIIKIAQLMTEKNFNSQCIMNFNSSIKSIFDSLNRLDEFIVYQDLGNPYIMKQKVVNSCANNACHTALTTLIRYMLGENFQDENSTVYSCDILSVLIDKDLYLDTYSGQQNLYLNPAAAVFQFILVGVGIESTLATIIKPYELSWERIQNDNEIRVREVLKRILGFDEGVRRNLNLYGQYNLEQYQVQFDYTNATMDQIANHTYMFLNDFSTEKLWFVYVYDSQMNHDIHYSSCSYCFYVYNLNNYNVMVFSIDKDALPDDNKLNQDWVSLKNQLNLSMDAFSDYVYQNEKVNIFTNVINEYVESSFIIPPEGKKFLRQFKNGFQWYIWATE